MTEFIDDKIEIITKDNYTKLMPDIKNFNDTLAHRHCSNCYTTPCNYLIKIRFSEYGDIATLASCCETCSKKIISKYN